MLTIKAIFLIALVVGIIGISTTKQFPSKINNVNTTASVQSPNSSNTVSIPVPTPINAPLLVPHFAFGLEDSYRDVSYLNGMKKNNGTIWDVRYQYLSGGVNSSSQWTTWNSPSGQFASNYISESDANGYIPAFVYYTLLQSSVASGNERQRDLATLNNPSIMNAYYNNWSLLMKKIGFSGKRTLVIIEPDLWGYIEQTSVMNKESSTQIPASVDSSGNADVKGLENNTQGFALALLHIRDLYAPNAFLAIDTSPFGTTHDINSDTSTRLNATQLGSEEGQFIDTLGVKNNPSNISSFDFVASDITNHDAAQINIWWDKNNIKEPNFYRYLKFISALSSSTGRHIIMWQVPVGNQYFDTMNNSAGHTQDNRAQYILSHISSFASSGIVAVLFGTGTNGTWAQDKMKDNVTNNSPISTYECNYCNNHTSIYPDDDGGYLRIFVGKYYQKGVYPL